MKNSEKDYPSVNTWSYITIEGYCMLNIAEIELNVLTRQCLNRRIGCIETVISEVKAWEESRNNLDSTIKWQFTTGDARVKLHRLYPTIEA